MIVQLNQTILPSTILHRNLSFVLSVVTFLLIASPAHSANSSKAITVSLSKGALAHLHDPKGSMSKPVSAEISRVLKQHFDSTIKGVLGKGVTINYNAVTTLASGQKDLNARANRLEVEAQLPVLNSKGEPAHVRIYIYLHINGKHPEYFTKQADKQNKRLQKNIDHEKKSREYCRKNNRKFTSYLLKLESHYAQTNYNGWKWWTPDARMTILIRTMDRKVDSKWIRARAEALDAGLSSAGLYSFHQRIFGKQKKEAVQGLSEAAAEARGNRLMQVVAAWEKRTGKRVTFKSMAGAAAVAFHLKMEDGARKPLRSGQEVALYNRLKGFARSQGKNSILRMGSVLTMALDVTPRSSDKTVNLFLALLTTHNVIRILARPEQWQGELIGLPKEEGHYGHPKTDSAYPILIDLLGIKSSDFNATMPATVKHRFGIRRRPDGSRVSDGNWSVCLFSPKGIFQSQPGIELAGSPGVSSHWNGGCHYYFWVGAMARPSLSPIGVWFGGRGEQSAKNETAAKNRGKVQISYFRAGATFTSIFMAKQRKEHFERMKKLRL
jgi:hypothetical protein